MYEFQTILLRIIVPYIIAFSILICAIVYAILPLLRKRRETTCKKLRYVQWVYRDKEPNGRYNGKVRLADFVANYALDRYPQKCNLVPWHIFMRTSIGSPLAVAFERDSYIIKSVRRLNYNELRNKRLRVQAECVDSPIESQFERYDARPSNHNEARTLLRLAKRYRYSVRFEGEKLLFEFTDTRPGGRAYLFAVDSFRPTFSGITNFGQRLPDEWLLTRKSTARPVAFDNGTTIAASVADLTSGVRSYESSPCFDKTIGRQTVGRRAVASLRDFERFYMRGIVRYPDTNEYTEKVKRFYFECVYATNAEKDYLIDESLRSEIFPIVTYLRTCPNEQPTFDAKRKVCV